MNNQNNKKDFIFFKNNKNTIYLDSAGSSVRPKQVLESMNEYYNFYSTNPHNADSKIGFSLLQRILNFRKKLQKLINANSYKEIIFVPSTTFGINQIAYGMNKEIKKGDEIVLTYYEHSSNLLPWIRLAKEKGAIIKFLKTKEDLIDINKIKDIVNQKTKIVSFAPNSNTFGYFNDPKPIISEIRKISKDITVVLDVAQTIIHQKIDVKLYDADFIVFSAQKLYGPTGIGVLYGKIEKLEKLEPLVIGGGSSLYIDKKTLTPKYAELPEKLEGGTPNTAAILGFEAAIDYINNNLGGIDNIHKKLIELRKYNIQEFKKHLKNKVTIYNDKYDASVLLFNINGVFSQDVASFLGTEKNIIIRAGEHCNKLLGEIIDQKTSLRISYSVFNDKKEIDKLVDILIKEDYFIGNLV